MDRARDGRPQEHVPGPRTRDPDEGGGAGTRRKRRQGAVVAIAGAVVVAIGSFLPWGEARAPFVGTVRTSGVEGGDGFFSLAMAGGVTLIAAAAYRSAPDRPARSRLGMAALVLGLLVLTLGNVVDTVTTLSELRASSSLVTTSFGVGLWLLALGTATIGVAWFLIPWAAGRPEPSGT